MNPATAAPDVLREATENQPAARAALSAALRSPGHAYLFAGPARVGQARRGARVRRRAARRRGRRARRRAPARARRPVAAPGPRLARPAGHPASGRRGARAGDRGRRLPTVRGGAPRVRDRGGRGDGGRGPERAPQDPRGAAAVRPPGSDHLRAGRAAGDGALALPGGSLRAAGRARPSRRASRSWGWGPARRSAGPRRAWPAATRTGRPFCSASRAVSSAPGHRRASRRRSPSELADAPWRGLLAAAEAAGAAGGRSGSNAARGLGRRRRRGRGTEGPAPLRARRRRPPGAPPAAPGPRRSTSALALIAAWLRDLAAVAEGAERLVLELRSRRGASRRGGHGRRRSRRTPRARAAPSS